MGAARRTRRAAAAGAAPVRVIGACLLLLPGALGPAATPANAQQAGAGSVAAASGVAAQKLEPRGRISLRDYYLLDNQSEHTTHLLGADLDLFVPRIAGTGVSVLIDGEIRKDLSYHPPQTDKEEQYDQTDPHGERDGDYLGRSDRSLGRIRGGTLGDYVRNAWLEYAGIGGMLAAQAGRMMLTDLGQVWVDGALLRLEKNGFLLGAFGGLAPDPFDYGFNSDNQSLGGFAGYTGRSLVLRLAFDHAMVGGETDRQFVFSSGHVGLFDQLFVSYSATVDLAGQKVVFPAGDWQGKEPKREDLGPQLTMGFFNVLWWATPSVSFTLTGDTFRNVPFRKSQPTYWPTELDRDVLKKMLEQKAEDRSSLPSYIQRLYLGDSTAFPAYYGLRFSPALRFGERWYGFIALDWRSRELDGEEARFIATGVRGEDVLGSGIAARLEYTARNGFLSDSNEIFASLSRKLFGRVDLGLYATVLEGRSMAKTFGRDLLLALREQGANPRDAPGVSTDRLDQRQTVWLGGVSLDIDITSRLYLVLDYELTRESLAAEDAQDEGELVIHGFNGRLTWRL